MNKNFSRALLIVAALILSTLVITGTITTNILSITAYLLILFGIGFFYSSYIKKYLAGVVIGSILFLSGSVMFVFTKYEILGFGKVFIPAALFILGVSLLIGNLLIRINKTSLILSIVTIIGGVWIIIDRGSTNLVLFLSAAFAIVKNYWLIIILSVVIIGLISYRLNKSNDELN
jgi:hypothetical protein